MTLHQLLTEGTVKLQKAGDLEAQLDARRLLLEAFQTDMVHFLMNRMHMLPESQETEQAIFHYHAMIGKRCERIPLPYILGSQEFMGLTFRVNRHVLIPRQDTETLVEQVLAEQAQRPFYGKEKRVLDLCTGSGCIAISLAVKGGFQDVTATDLSEKALCVARENAGNLLKDTTLLFENWEPQHSGREPGGTGCPEPVQGNQITDTIQPRFTLCKGDLFGALSPGCKFDLLVSNPPYIPTPVINGLMPEVRDNEPRMALDGSQDGMEFYRRIAAEAGKWLNPGASLYLEIGYDQGSAVCELLGYYDFQHIKVIKDLPGMDRVVRADYP